VTFLRALKLGVVAAVFAATIALKSTGPKEAPRPTGIDLDQTIENWLARQGFAVSPGAFGHGSLGRKNDCQVHVENVELDGENLQAMRIREPDNAREFFVYRGRILSDYPSLRVDVGEIWRRISLRLGFSASRVPCLVIWATGPCAVEALPWMELAEID